MIEETLHDTRHITIKWPNDIYWRDKKIAGILIENRVCGDTISESIAGIGINVNQDVFPKNIPNAVSLSLIKKKQYSTAQVLEQLIANIRTLNQYYTTNRDLLDIDYRKALYRIGSPSLFISGKEQFKGIIQDVDGYGRLIIKDAQRIRRFDFKQIEFVI
jgi:BirA family biotin operon repressor/biotin-[acetyl-CoA-carboxylase] ligase